MAGSPADVANEAEAFIHDYGRSGNLIPDAERFLRVAAAGTERAIPNVIVEDLPVIAPVVAEFAAGFFIWVLLLAFLVGLLALRIFESVIVGMARRVPIVGVGLSHIVQGWLHVIDNLENWVIRGLGQACYNSIRAIAAFIQMVTGLQQGSVAHVTNVTKVTNVTQSNTQQIQQLRQEITQLRTIVAANQYSVQNKTVTVGVPQNLWDQLHVLGNEVQTLRQDMNEVQSELHKLNNTDTATNHQLQTLTSGLHGLRAISVSWSEVQQELGTVSMTLSSFMDQTAAELERQSGIQHHMAPLGLLLQPGIPGLKNLRTLEDNMCQCPRLPNFTNEVGTALALYEFLSYG